ncbi:MAG TPA: 6-pyruvoyl-tetrahydropterin synthase-related protein, partial [Candidatus Acidoferrum sp.]
MPKTLREGLPVIALVVVALALTLPLLVHGLTPGHDRRVHVEYQHELNQQIDAGEFYPRWLPGLNLGHGSPIFFVQYPLPYFVAWGLGHLIPNHWGIYRETRALGLAMVLATVLGALFTYAWCRTFVDGVSAVIASLVFLTLPYLFWVDLYLRAAIGEVWALALSPLVFYFVERRTESPRRSLAGGAFSFALVLLSHLFTAVMLVPLLFAYNAWRAEPTKRVAALLQTGATVALGVAVAGVYTLPFLAQRHFLHPENVIAIFGANYAPLSQIFPFDHFMFPGDTPAWSHVAHFARYSAAITVCLIGYVWYHQKPRESSVLRLILAAGSVAMLGLTVMSGHIPLIGPVRGALVMEPSLIEQREHIFVATFLTLIAACLCYWFLWERTSGRRAELFLSIALVSYWMTTRFSRILWTKINALSGIQFPWRFNVILALATTGLVALAVASLRKQPLRERLLASTLFVAVWGFASAGIAIAGRVNETWSTPPFANVAARDPALPVYAEIKTLDETREIFPPGASKTPLSVIVTSDSGAAELTMPGSRRMELHTICETNCSFRIGQFYYPAWRAR